MTNFSNKEMLIRIMDKIESMETKVYETHELAIVTNGKVRLHTKIIWGLAGAGLTITTTAVSLIIKYL